jgi:predicted aldo/keto reductase-like oxidoreductase
VEYFDFYFFHALNASRHKFFTEEGIYDIGKELLKSGRIRHLGMSFHDTADVLDQILTDRPEIEVVQLQFNYVDYLDPKIQSRDCYEVCRKHGKPVMVMEPVKGGALATLPENAGALLTQGSPASYALRYAASFENVIMVLSGMSSMDQVLDNIATMREFMPLTEAEHRIIDQVRTIYQGQNKIPCTACRYCVEDCPAGLDIPVLFACLNDKHQKAEGAQERYEAQAVKADACIGCGHCETVCPQGLHIPRLLKEVAAGF